MSWRGDYSFYTVLLPLVVFHDLELIFMYMNMVIDIFIAIVMIIVIITTTSVVVVFIVVLLMLLLLL